MKKILFSLILLLSVHAVAQSKYKVGVFPLMPYLGKSASGNWEGFIGDIFQVVEKENKMHFQFVELPLARQLQVLQKKEVDFIIVPGYMVRYLPDIDIVSSAFGVSFAAALTVLPESEVLIDFDDLAGKTVLLTFMGPETDNLRKALYAKSANVSNELVEIAGYDISSRMFLMLNSQRSQVALGDYNILRYALFQSKAKNIRLVPTSFSGFSSIVLVTWKGHKDFKRVDRAFEKWFATARKNGQLEKILKKYNLEDWRNLLSH